VERQDKGTWIWLAVVAAILLLRWQGCDLSKLTTTNPSTPPLIVMLYEAQHGPLSPDAIGAASDLTASGREVRMVDDDVTDGTNETPDWLKPALQQGRLLMGGTTDELQKDDALILLSGERVVKAIKMPATKAETLEACK
jgi:hypothetical protein